MARVLVLLLLCIYIYIYKEREICVRLGSLELFRVLTLFLFRVGGPFEVFLRVCGLLVFRA